MSITLSPNYIEMLVVMEEQNITMNFNLSEEQNLLKDSVSKFITNDYDYETRSKHVKMEKGFFVPQNSL